MIAASRKKSGPKRERQKKIVTGRELYWYKERKAEEDGSSLREKEWYKERKAEGDGSRERE